jgi:hypothetical protein
MSKIFGTNEPEENMDNREILKTQDMIESSFLNSLKKSDTKIASQIGNAVVETIESVTETAPSANTEGLMLDLFEIRDGLIESFESVSLNTTVASSLANNINKVGSCIQNIGGQVDEFIPLDHVSGLQAPDMDKSANKVIEMTRQCYTLGNITQADIKDDGQTIAINFEGQEGDISYKARGTITANTSWKGNEAIDYIYTAGAGRMSVKAFRDNRWTNNNDDYSVYWELDEIDLTAEVSEVLEAGKENEKKSENKEEIVTEVENKIDDDDIEISDSFPIEEN